jgi:hypothetical protein
MGQPGRWNVFRREQFTVIREFSGACPGEGGCTLRKWTVKGDISVYQDRSTSSPVVFRLSKGEMLGGLRSMLDVNRTGRASRRGFSSCSWAWRIGATFGSPTHPGVS